MELHDQAVECEIIAAQLLSRRYDEVLPLKDAIEPLYRILREPKRLVLYDGGHFATLETAAPIVNGWLDQTLGHVTQ